MKSEKLGEILRFTYKDKETPKWLGEWHDELIKYESDIEKQRKKGLVKVKRDVWDFKKEFINDKEMRKRRLVYLVNEQKKAIKRKKELEEFVKTQTAQKALFKDLKQFIIPLIKQYEKKIKSYSCEFWMKIKPKQSKSQITDQDILRANETPIESIIEVNSRHYALCPFHDDNNPSFYVKNGFGYCFSCGASADPIKLTMELRGLKFIEAVKFLIGK